MKKITFCLSVIASLIVTTAFANNDCIENISSHYYPEWGQIFV